MLLTTIFFSVAALLLFSVNMVKNKQHLHGLILAFQQMFKNLPVLLAAFFLSGMTEAIIPGDFVQNWLSAEAGFKGVFMGTFMGMSLFVGPYASFPIIGSLYNAGASLATTIALTTGWSLLNLTRLPFEGSLLGLRFSLGRIAFSIPFCFAVGVVAYFLEMAI